MKISDHNRERLITAITWLGIMGVSAMAVFGLRLALWVGYVLGFKM